MCKASDVCVIFLRPTICFSLLDRRRDPRAPVFLNCLVCPLSFGQIALLLDQFTHRHAQCNFNLCATKICTRSDHFHHSFSFSSLFFLAHRGVFLVSDGQSFKNAVLYFLCFLWANSNYRLVCIHSSVWNEGCGGNIPHILKEIRFLLILMY